MFRVWGLGVWGLGVWGSGVWGLGVWGLGFRGLEFRVQVESRKWNPRRVEGRDASMVA